MYKESCATELRRRHFLLLPLLLLSRFHLVSFTSFLLLSFPFLSFPFLSILFLRFDSSFRSVAYVTQILFHWPVDWMTVRGISPLDKRSSIWSTICNSERPVRPSVPLSIRHNFFAHFPLFLAAYSSVLVPFCPSCRC